MVWESCSLRGFVVNERIVNVDVDLVVDSGCCCCCFLSMGHVSKYDMTKRAHQLQWQCNP